MAVYLDYMASTPLDPQVVAEMTACLSSPLDFGNPASHYHAFGRQAAGRIEYARQQVADFIRANPREIIWTSGATEANNLALKGAALFYQRQGKHLITLRSEHQSVLHSCAYLENMGFQITYLNPNAQGILCLEELQAALRPDTILVSVGWVNNETGVIQNIPQISHMTRERGIILHVDAVQAAGKIPIDLQALPIDLLSLSAHKLYGPKGIGALYIRRTPRVRLTPLIHGGEQEQGLRSGTLSTHQIVGMGAAFAIAQAQWDQDQQHAGRLGAELWQGLQTIDAMQLNGDSRQRVPHCVNVSFDGVEAETLLESLTDLALSTGSACHSAQTTPSHVLTAMGIDGARARRAVRISLGRFTTAADIDYAVREIRDKVIKLRQLSPLWSA